MHDNPPTVNEAGRCLNPLVELDAFAENAAEYRFTAESLQEALDWQKRCRAALAETVGFLDTPVVDPNPETVEEVDLGDLIRRKVVISTAPRVCMPLYLLVPKRPRQSQLPVVIAYHGHGYGVKDIVALTEKGEPREPGEGYHADFAVALCRRGFLVAAPEISCFGERVCDYSYLNGRSDLIPSSCHNVATYAFMLGKSAVGMRVRDSVRMLDYLSGVPEADTSRVGAMGISGGGMLTFFHTALDERVRACAISGYFSSFRKSILSINHCTCNFVPGILKIGEMHDIAGLITPRPMLIEAGTLDPIFPIEAVREAVKRVKDTYRVFGADPEFVFEFDEFEGGHRISGRLSYDFLAKHLELPTEPV